MSKVKIKYSTLDYLTWFFFDAMDDFMILHGTKDMYDGLKIFSEKEITDFLDIMKEKLYTYKQITLE